MIRIRDIALPPEHNAHQLRFEAAQLLRVSNSKVRNVRIVRRSVDARKKPDIKIIYTIDVTVDGNEKKIQAKVIDTIEVNMGGGNIENRPVIELDIKFAGEDYKKIPFSVSDRSTNTNPILISKGFVQDELEALIDVGATNISNDGIDVVYGEST